MKNTIHRDVLKYFTFFCIISLIVFIAQNFLPSSQFLDSLFITDVVNVSQTLDYIHTKYITLDSAHITGIYWLYYVPWKTHPAFCFIINIILIYFSIKFIYEIFVLNNLTKKSICLSVILNPYLYLVVTGPNKEIPMLFSTLFVVNYIIFKKKKWFIKCILVSISSYFIRDGYGIILLFYVIISVIPKITASLRWKLGVLISFFASIGYFILFSGISIFARNILSTDYEKTNSTYLGNFLLTSTNPFLSSVQFLLKIIYNWLSLSIFPVLYTPNGGFYSTGYAYWVFGILISIGILACLYIVLSPKENSVGEKNKILIAGFVIYILFAISVLPFLQPRYLMPVLPLALGILMSLKKNKKSLIIWIMVLFSFTVIFIYTLKGNPPATLHEINQINSSFLINS